MHAASGMLRNSQATCTDVWSPSCVYVLSGWVLACLLCAPIEAQSSKAAPYPPPGQLVDLGGYRVHLYCTGQGDPTVVVVGGGFSFDWDLVQSEVAKFTKVCTYDVAGTAWSDPHPGSFGTCPDRVSEVHELLNTARIGG